MVFGSDIFLAASRKSSEQITRLNESIEIRTKFAPFQQRLNGIFIIRSDVVLQTRARLITIIAFHKRYSDSVLTLNSRSLGLETKEKSQSH